MFYLTKMSHDIQIYGTQQPSTELYHRTEDREPAPGIVGFVARDVIGRHVLEPRLSHLSTHLILNREGRWGTPQMISQPLNSIFPVLHCPLGLGELQACPFPDVVARLQ